MSEHTIPNLADQPMSIDNEDFELYHTMLALNVAIQRARIELMVNGRQTERMEKYLTTIGAIYEIFVTVMGDCPPSTGSRRCRLREHLPGRMFRGDPRPAGDVGGYQRQDPAEYPGLGFPDSRREKTGPR